MKSNIQTKLFTEQEAPPIGNVLLADSASRHFLFAATFKLDTYETATQNFGHVRKADFPTITNLKDVVRSYHKKANNIVILSISEVKEDEFKRFFSEQD